MKLIIDIPEEAYRARQHWVANPKRIIDEVDIAIANGTPYNPTGDLISREALKSALEVTQYNDIDDLTRTERLIDNAPTVFDCRSCKNNGNERECVDCHDYCNFVKYEERPQGEWIETQRGIHVTDYKCSCCGRTVRDDTGYDVSKDYPYCHCGADMRKGGAE